MKLWDIYCEALRHLSPVAMGAKQNSYGNTHFAIPVKRPSRLLSKSNHWSGFCRSNYRVIVKRKTSEPEK